MIKKFNIGTSFIGLIFLCLLVICVGCSSSSSGDVADGGTDIGNPDYEVTVAGSVQKGPFQINSQVDIFELDNNFNQTGTIFRAETDSFGNFSMPVRLNSKYIELFVEGYYFDEITGVFSSSGQLDLSVLSSIENNSRINFNVLTTIAKPRVLQLISDGLTMSAANIQACAEVLNAFGIVDIGATLFEDMTMLEDGNANSILMAVSAILMQMAHDTGGTAITAELHEIISTIKNDIAPDGILDDNQGENIITRIAHAKMAMDLAAVRFHMETQYPNATIPPFENYIRGYLDINWSIDCSTSSIATIQVDIYDTVTGHIYGGPWPCNNDIGSLLNLNAGIYDSVTLYGFDSDGDIVYQAVENNIDITVNQTTTVEATPPSAEITSPTDNAVFSKCDAITFSGNAEDYNGNPLSGASVVWISSIDGFLSNGTSFSTDDLTPGTHDITMTVTEGDNDIAIHTISIDVEATPPTVTITSPLDEDVFSTRENIVFNGTAYNCNGTPLTGGSLLWTSSIDGNIGTGTNLNIFTLSDGIHTITLSAADSDGDTGSDSITITVKEIIGHIDIPIISDIFVAGNYAYVAAGSDGLYIIDISDPWNPAIENIVDMPSRRVFVEGNYLYVLDWTAGDEGIVTMDITDPANPTLISKLNINEPCNLFVSAPYAYVTTNLFSTSPSQQVDGFLNIIDMTNPATPYVAGSISTFYGGYGIQVAGSYAYIANDLDGFKIVDVSDPTAPTIIGQMLPYQGGSAQGVQVIGPYAYITSIVDGEYEDGFSVVDISDPQNSSIIAKEYSGGSGRDIYVDGQYAYLANGGRSVRDYSGLQIIDIGDPSNPVTMDVVLPSQGLLYAVYVSDGYVYCGGSDTGFLIMRKYPE